MEDPRLERTHASKPTTLNLLLLGLALFVTSTLLGTGAGYWIGGAQTPSPSSQSTVPAAPSTDADPSTPPAPTSSYEPPSGAATPSDVDPSQSQAPSEPTWTAEESVPSIAPSPEATENDVEQTSYASLERRAAADRRQTNLDGQWAAQLASKFVGVRDPRQRTATGSDTFYAFDILAEHVHLRDAFSEYDVRLLRGQDFGRGRTRDGATIWYTFAVNGFESEADVRDFCESAFPGFSGADLENRCVPRQLKP